MASLSTLIAQNLEDTPSKLVDLQLFLDNINSGSGLGGTNYVFVRGDRTPEENAVELKAAYNKAKTMSPSSGNTVTIVVAPGTYTFGSTAFTVDTPYIDIVSLTGNADVVLGSIEEGADGPVGVHISTDNVFLKGINTKELQFYIYANNYSNIKCEDCIGGDASFGGGYIVSGTFINCAGGNGSFGGNGGTASGTFTNCTGGDYSFGGGGISSGTFNYCTGGDFSFGGEGTASGTFTNCIGGNSSFGGGGDASGNFTNCIGGDGSFGGYGTASGTFENCKGLDDSFGGGGGTASGVFTDCTGGDASFGAGGAASGTFTNCIGGNSSFGGDGGTITSTARLYYCRLTSGTFETPAAGGKLVLCIDGNGNLINSVPITIPNGTADGHTVNKVQLDAIREEVLGIVYGAGGIGYEYITGLSLASGSVTPQAVYLEVDADKTCYVILPDNTVLTSTAGVIDTTWAGAAGAVNLIVPKETSIVNISNVENASDFIGELKTLCEGILDCRVCTSLTSLSAPNATTIHAVGCTSLTSLSAPNATTIYASGCTSLTSLSAPNATTIYASGCALTAVAIAAIVRATVFNIADLSTVFIDVSGGTNADYADLSAQAQSDIHTIISLIGRVSYNKA